MSGVTGIFFHVGSIAWNYENSNYLMSNRNEELIQRDLENKIIWERETGKKKKNTD
jgi:hypothetical protein